MLAQLKKVVGWTLMARLSVLWHRRLSRSSFNAFSLRGAGEVPQQWQQTWRGRIAIPSSVHVFAPRILEAAMMMSLVELKMLQAVKPKEVQLQTRA